MPYIPSPYNPQDVLCQKIGPQSNNKYIVKSLNKMQNTLSTLQRDTDITWFTKMMGYNHKDISIPSITVQKDEGIQLEGNPLHFLFPLSQSLPHNHRDCLQYKIIPYTVVLQCFLLQGKYHGKILWLTQYHGSAKLLSNTHPLNPKEGGMSVQYTWVTKSTE